MLSPELIRLALKLNTLAIERPPFYMERRAEIFAEIFGIISRGNG